MNKKEKALITKNQLYCIIERYNMRIDRLIVTDGSIDVAGDVYITDTSLRKLPFKFGKVKGDFYCNSNKLTTLKGALEFVGGDFNCSNNQLKNLKYAPKEVGGSFSCHDNVLISLNGCPKHIRGNFNAFLNRLSTLEGGPEIIDGNCSLFENQLTSLESGPAYAGGSFHITGNLLTNLIGLPRFIGNVLSFDNTISLYTGNINCVVKSVKIEMERHKKNQFLPPLIKEQEKYLPVVFKYMPYLFDFIFLPNFNQSNFEGVISDIQAGLR